MFKKLALAWLLALWSSIAWAQNPTCPLRPTGDNTNACASTSFVQQAISGGGASPESANTVFAGPTSGAAAAPTFRSLVPADIPAGVLTGVINAQTSAYAAVSGDCSKTISLGGSAEYALTVGAASGFPAQCTMLISNADTGRGKVMTINGVTFPLLGILWPGMSFVLQNVNNVWTISGLQNLWKITNSITFNIDTATGVDGNNDCLGALGSAGACATLANALGQFCQIADVVNAQVTFQTKTGQTHPSQGLCVYHSSDLSINNNVPTIVGDVSSCANASNFVIDGGASIGVNPVGVTTGWIIKGMKITSSTNGTAITADNHSYLFLGTNTVFAAVTGFHVRAMYDSFVEFVGNYCITGGAAVHANSENGGKVLAQPSITVTITNTPAFTSFFAQSIKNGAQEWASVTFSGPATGPRYSATTGGGIDTNGGGATFLPGNSAGSTNNPGWYN